MRKRLPAAAAIVAVLAILATLASPAQSDQRTEIRSRTVTVQVNAGYQCTSDPRLIEILGETAQPAEAEGWLFVQEQPVGQMCVLSDWPEPVEVTLWYLALRG